MSTLSQVGGIPEIGTGFLQPKQSNKWRVQFLGFGNLSNTTPLSMQARKVGRPDLKFESHKLHRYNSIAKVLGKHEFGNLTLTLDDDIGSTVGSIVQAQLQRQQQLIGAGSGYLAAGLEGSLYKFATVLDLLNGNDGVLESWTYEGCQIIEWKVSELDYSKSDELTIDLTLTIDNMYQTFNAISSNNMALGGVGLGG